MSAEAPLLPLVKKYLEEDPVRAAHSLETLPEEEAVAVLNELPAELSVSMFPHLPLGFAASLFKDLNPELFQEIARKLDPEKVASIFMGLPKEAREKLLELLTDDVKRQIVEFISYPEDSAGKMMTTDILSFHTTVKVKEAVQRIRMLAQRRYPLSYAYVVSRDNILAGVINMRDLMLADPETALESIMRKDVFAVSAFLDRELVAEELSKRKFFAAPVVDLEGRLLGVVKAEELIKGVQQEATEDLQKMFGAGGDERAFSPMAKSLKTRLPWLHVNLLTAFLAASVVALFQDVIAKITILAVFLPVVAGQGGNAGAQSLAIVMRGLVMREIPRNKIQQLILKETMIGVINGIVVGIVTALIAWAWYRNPYLGVVVGLGMVVNLMIAGFAGAAIPICMKALKLDPAQCSNIILTTVTDVMGFFAFLGFAVMFQEYLV